MNNEWFEKIELWLDSVMDRLEKFSVEEDDVYYHVRDIESDNQIVHSGLKIDYGTPKEFLNRYTKDNFIIMMYEYFQESSVDASEDKD